MWSKSSINHLRDIVAGNTTLLTREKDGGFCNFTYRKNQIGGSVKGMLKHNFREIDTPNADEERTPNNDHMTAVSVQDGMRRYRERLPDKVRKNAVHAIDYLVTTSPEATPEANAAALSEAYAWVVETYGEKNIIMATKHYDETTAHIHILVMPIDDKGKLNARKFIGGTKHRMSELQDDFFERIKTKKLPWSVASKAQNLSIKL